MPAIRCGRQGTCHPMSARCRPSSGRPAVPTRGWLVGRAVCRLLLGPVVATGLTVASFAVGPLSAVADDGSGTSTTQAPPSSDPGAGAPSGTTDSTAPSGTTDGTAPSGPDSSTSPDVPPTGN